jgi:hypothetical protein
MKAPPLDADALFWLGGPVVASIAIALGGLFIRKRAAPHLDRAGSALLLIGVVGLIVSAAWIALVFRVEAIEHESVGRMLSV